MTTFATNNNLIDMETRGAKPKYDFNLKVGEFKFFPEKEKAKIRSAVNAFISRKGLDWKFRTTVKDGKIMLIRIK